MTRKCRSKRGVAQDARREGGLGRVAADRLPARVRPHGPAWFLLLAQPIAALSLADIVRREARHVGAQLIS
jgi:hypothetical protein